MFLESRVRDDTLSPSLLGVCAGYEAGSWRVIQLAEHLILDCLLDFVLSFEAAQQVNSLTAGRQLAEAAKVVYQTDKYGKRGEFGELILHVILRQFYDTVPAISKLFVKSAVNETVKGFDAVHVTVVGDEIDLWLGEAKFYTDGSRAIDDMVKEIVSHVESEYLKNEFILIRNKLDPNWPHYGQLQRLIAPQRSLDEVFARLHIPALITYESSAVSNHAAVTQEFLAALEAEIRTHWARISGSGLPGNVMVHFIVLPLGQKSMLLEGLHNRLLQLQGP